MKNSQWLGVHLYCFLIGRFIASPSTRPLSISTVVGDQAVLPCSWRTRPGVRHPPRCHVQWVSLADTVFEQWGDKRFEAAEYRGRLEVPEERLGSGDCSLVITDVQLGDTGGYDGFMVVDGEQSRKTRVFIQSVWLYVQDHKVAQTGSLGGQVDLELHTKHSVRVVYQGRNGSDWSVLWMRGEASPRLEKDPLLEKLTLKELKHSDEGTYKVLDEQGLSVSTVQLRVEATPPAGSSARMHHREPTAEDMNGVGGRSSSLVLLLSALAVFSEAVLF